jgi:hypothetical protein
MSGSAAPSLACQRAQLSALTAAVFAALILLSYVLGSELAQGPVTFNNQGQVTTSKAANALQLNGDGGAISYSGDGGIKNTDKTKAALDAHNQTGRYFHRHGSWRHQRSNQH